MKTAGEKREALLRRRKELLEELERNEAALQKKTEEKIRAGRELAAAEARQKELEEAERSSAQLRQDLERELAALRKEADLRQDRLRELNKKLVAAFGLAFGRKRALRAQIENTSAELAGLRRKLAERSARLKEAASACPADSGESLRALRRKVESTDDEIKPLRRLNFRPPYKASWTACSSAWRPVTRIMLSGELSRGKGS